MLKICTHFGYKLSKKVLSKAKISLLFFVVYGLHNLSAQSIVSFLDTVTINTQCFDISEFTVNDLATTCSTGFSDVVITSDAGDCPEGIVFVNYSGEDNCLTPFSLSIRVNVEAGLSAEIPDDVNVACFDDIDLLPSDVTVSNTCGDVNITIEVDDPPEGAEICASHVRSVTYTIEDNCSSIELERLVSVDPSSVSLDVGGDEEVECAEDINLSVDDITIDLPCAAEVLDISFTEPDLSDPFQTCNIRLHTFTWNVETTCGNFSARKRIRIRNEEVKIIGAEDVTISCSDHPLSDEELLGGLSLEYACSNYPESDPIELARPNEEFPDDFTNPQLYTYRLQVFDECTGSEQSEQIRVTVLPESPTITFDEEVTTIPNLELLLSEEFLLLGANAIPGCCEISAFGPIESCALLVARGANGPGELFQVEYRALDACGNVAFALRTFLFEPPVTLLETEVMVECFNLADFTEADLSTTCDEGFANVVVAVVPFDGQGDLAEECFQGIVRVNYTGFTNCGDEFSLEKEVDITNPGLTVMIPPDMTISCADDFNPPTAADVTANSPCGESVVIQISEDEIPSEVCFDRRRSFTYTVSDDCETIELTQNITITQVPLLLDVGPRTVTVGCVDDIVVSEDDIDIQLPCDDEIISIEFSEPDLSSETANCNGRNHLFVWNVITNCTSKSIEKRFIIDLDLVLEDMPRDVSVSCSELPTSDEEILDLFFDDDCGSAFDFVQVFLDLDESTDSPECGGILKYTIFFYDFCSDSMSIDATLTVIPDPLLISFDEEVTTIACLEDLDDFDFLAGVTVSSPCSELDGGLSIGEAVIESDVEGSCDGTVVTVEYSGVDQCGNMATASRRFITDNSDLSIVVAPDEEVECLEAIVLSANDVTINNSCNGSEVEAFIIENEEFTGCPGEVISAQYSVNLFCGEVRTLFRNFTISETDLDPIVSSPALVNGATLNFSCDQEEEIDDLLNADAVLFESFFCFTELDARSKVCLRGEFEKIELAAQNCAEDGRLKRFQFNWTIEDDCGRTGSFTMFANVVDESAPVLNNLPLDLTIGCDEEIPLAPVVTAEDDCGIVEVEFLETMNLVEVGSFTQKHITRTWSSTDECGNNTTEVRRVTIIDEESPALSFLNENGEEIENGSILTFECDEELGGFSDLSKDDIIVSDNCASLSPEFEILTESELVPNTGKVVDVFVPTWTVSDDFGNVSEFSFIVQVLDTKAPVFVGADTLYICDEIEEVDGFAIDNCGIGFTEHIDRPNINSDPGVFIRRYIINDEKNNFTFKDQVVVDLTSRPKLIAFKEGFEVDQEVFSCINDLDQLTSYGPENVESTFETDIALDITFEEKVLPFEGSDSTLLLELRWTAVTPCGYAETITEIVNLIDTIAPQFDTFTQNLVLDCDVEIPSILAFDACGLVSLEYQDSIVSNTCGYEREMLRTYTAIDASGNVSHITQGISIIDTFAPVFDEKAVICSSEAEDVVYAYDPCSNQKIVAEVVNDSLVLQCEEKSIHIRTLMAVDPCGNTSYFKQEIYDDNFYLEYEVADVENQDFLSLPYSEVKSNDLDNLQRIRNFSKHSIVASDSCGNEFDAEFTRDIIVHEDCDSDYVYTFVLKWFYVDLCGSEYSYNVEIGVLRKEVYIEPMLQVSCSAEIPMVEIYGLPSTVPYTEEIRDYRSEDGSGYVLRQIRINNYCGEVINLEQSIEYDAEFTASIIGDMTPVCDDVYIPYQVELEGGRAPYDVQWETIELAEIVKESTLSANIMLMESETTISAEVVDANGCTVSSEVVVVCAEIDLRSNALEDDYEMEVLELTAFPNPFIDQIRIESNASINSKYAYYLYNHLGQLQVGQKGTFADGPNIFLNLSDYPSGVYYLSLDNEGRKETLKIIKI